MIKRKRSFGIGRPRSPLVVDMVPFALLDDPLEYILAEHVRHRSICWQPPSPTTPRLRSL